MAPIFILCLALLPLQNSALRLAKTVAVDEDAPKKHKVAIMISGTLKRYIAESSLEHLVKPMVAQGHTVDFYLGLNKEGHTPWTKYDFNEPMQDPFFAGANSTKDIQQLMEEAVANAGGHLRGFHLLDHVDISEALASSKQWPNHKDSSFLFQGFKKSAATNFLKLFKVVEDLWREVEAEEKKSGDYTHVVLLRDDAYWYQNFDLNVLLKAAGRSDSQVMVLDCSKGSTYDIQKTNHLQDYVFVLSRAAAPHFAHTYTTISQSTCDGKTKLSPSCGATFQNSENFFFELTRQLHLEVSRMDVSYIPFQPARYYMSKSQDPKLAEVCIHKRCTSNFAFERQPECKKVSKEEKHRK